MQNYTYNQQDITFKLSDLLYAAVEIKFIGSNTLLNAYSIEALISAYMEDLGLKLVIEDMAKFECGHNPSDDDLPF